MLRIAFIQQVMDFLRPFGCPALFPGGYVPPSRQWLRKHEDAACPFPDILRIRLL